MKKVLVVVDMQLDFICRALGTPNAIAILPNVVKKIREWDGPVIATLDTHTNDYLDTREGKYLPVKHCVMGTPGHKIEDDVINAIKDKPEHKFVIKETFGSTLLPTIIKEYEPEAVEFIGLCTDICVVSNVLITKAVFPETDIAVDASCCAGVTPDSHKAALLTMKMCQVDILNDADTVPKE